MSTKNTVFAMRILSAFLVMALSVGPMGTIPAHAAGILHVTPNGNGDCSDWANACSLQTALTNAVSGDEIWVQAGIYKPTTDTDRTATFQLKSGVAVYGGFAGTESTREERDFTLNVTTLSGDLSGNDNDTILSDEPTRADNSYHVVTGASGVILDGFTVTAGNANGTSFPNDSGGGLFEFYGGSILTNILFFRNTSMGGGGMLSVNSDAILTDIVFRENNALSGGGGLGSFGGDLTITRVIFDGNSSASAGGGMVSNQGNLALTDVAFVGNTADMGGGLYNQSYLVMNNITFFDNSAVTYGGGMMNRGQVTLTNATFAGNSADNGGGFVDASSSKHEVSTLTNITFTGNMADTDGGAVYNLYSYVTIRNSILWGNTDLSGLQVYDTGIVTINDSVVQGECSVYSMCTNIITDDPLLGTLGDYGGYTQTISIQGGSPAIDATSNNCPTTDQRGLPRSNPACDIGAYELQTSNVLYAAPGGLDSGACSSWAEACDLQYALTNALSGQEIWAKAGTYKPTSGTDRAATFQLKSGVAVYGGFVGTETTRGQRNLANNITTLSGDLLGNDNNNVVYGEPTRADNSYHVVRGANGAILDGFVITAGNANGGSDLDFGGGIYNNNNSPLLENIIFSGNVAYYGGAMANNPGSPTLRNISFINNAASYVAGAIINQGNSNPTITNATFSGNSASYSETMYNMSSSPILTNVTFIGTMENLFSSNPILTNVTMNGRMHNWYNSNPIIQNSIIWLGYIFNDETSFAIVSDSVIHGGYAGGTNIIADDPLLGELGDHGGFTQTIPLLHNSSAIDATSNNCPATDQRGLPRSGPACDIGAYELQENDFTVRYAIPDGQDYGTCQNWSDACELSYALSIANPGEEVWAAAGTYKPTTGTSRAATFQLKYGVAVYGGFTGTETIRGQRNPTLNLTVLSGDLNGDDNGFVNNSENVYHVVTGVDGAATLDGFTITGGNADGGSGGGLYAGEHNLVLKNLIFHTNYAGYGGGMSASCSNGGSTIKNVIFSENVANEGGGIFSGRCDLRLTDVTFNKNSANMDGGGIYNALGFLTLRNVTFSDNSAHMGGGIFNGGSMLTTLTNVTFSGNSASANGGGMFNDGSILTLTNVTLNNNSAATAGNGIFNQASNDLTIQNSILWNGGDEIYASEEANTVIISDSIVQGGYTDGTNIITDNPNLGALGNYGGFTQTILLLAGSSAIDTGSDLDCPNTDQRGATRPQGAHCDIGAFEYSSATFIDVPISYWAWSFIERLYNDGITGGCSTNPLMYCPETSVTRAQMAVLLLRGIHGQTYNPPAATGAVFADVPTSHWASAWIEQLAAEGITGGCGNGNFCPDLPVTRDQMAVFLLRAKHGSAYTPPAPTGVFTDVPTDHWAAAWIEQLATEGITGGCGSGIYCPAVVVNRAQMAVFLVRAFNLP